MYKLFNNGVYSVCISEYVDMYSIVCKHEDYKVNIFLFKDMQHFNIKCFYQKELIHYKKMHVFKNNLDTSKKIINYIMGHMYINDVNIQLMVINSLNIFFNNF